MKDIIGLFDGFQLYKDMPKENYNYIKKYNHAFFKQRKYPRFFQSYLYLKSERKYFYCGEIEDCFILVKKKKEFGNKIFYLVLPPISFDGDLKKEKRLIDIFANNGIKTKISEEDIQLYNIDKKDFRRDPDNIEHIYDPLQFVDLKKPTYFKFRYYYNKLIKYLSENKLELIISKNITADQIKRSDTLIDRWNKYKNMHGDRCHNWFNDNTDNVYFEILNKNNEVVCSSINEKISNNHVLITTNYSDYSCQLKDLQINKAIHCLMMKYWADQEIKYISSGSGGWDKTLTAHKRQLRPIKELRIFDTKIHDKLSEEEYQQLCRRDVC
jgi:hypothetical protein